MMKNAAKTPRRAVLMACLALTAAVLGPGAAAAELEIGWTAWSDAEFTTKLAARVLEDRLGYDVTLTLVDVALQYQGLARGDLDAMLMAWLPDTHADYFREYRDDVVDLGPIYTGARLGWVVPAYVPESEVSSIRDLAKPEVAERLRHEIFGIDPGAGLTRLSEAALETYGLERYNLVTSSGAAMTAMVDRAETRGDWIVATAWRPHWMFDKWDLRFLDDPEGALGGLEHVDALVRRGLYAEHPDVIAFLSRFYLELDDLEKAMSRAEASSYEDAVEAYIAAHPRRVRYWATGELD